MSDVLIIGGGIAGISACAQIAPYAEVVLLEAEPELCYHSSGRSAATYIEDYGNHVTKELNKASLTFLKSDSQGFLAKRGLLLLGKQGEETQFESDAEDLGLKCISIDEAFPTHPSS
jgi:glycine/D-amino acid oxidase-like deaminating enzyme